MEEMEVPVDHLHEEINERAKEERNWSLYVAISTALMAVFASIASMMAGHDSNEALIEQIKASDQWSYYQAKGIKVEILKTSLKIDSAKILQESREQVKIRKTAEEEQLKSKNFLAEHVLLARCVTFFQIAIAISAISIITRTKVLWYFAIIISLVGIVIFVLNLL